jgi:hypothetical protein
VVVLNGGLDLQKRNLIIGSVLTAHPHLLVRVTSERFLPTLIQWLSLAKPTLKVALVGRNRSLVECTT